MNLTDLSELMDERYDAEAVPVLADSRVDCVRRRVSAARRRRGVTAVAAVVLLVAGAWVGLDRGTAGRGAAMWKSWPFGLPAIRASSASSSTCPVRIRSRNSIFWSWPRQQ